MPNLSGRYVTRCPFYIGTVRGWFTRPLHGRLCGAPVETYGAEEPDLNGVVVGFHICSRGHQTFNLMVRV